MMIDYHVHYVRALLYVIQSLSHQLLVIQVKPPLTLVNLCHVYLVVAVHSTLVALHNYNVSQVW